jgi:hypothetical protein
VGRKSRATVPLRSYRRTCIHKVLYRDAPSKRPIFSRGAKFRFETLLHHGKKKSGTVRLFVAESGTKPQEKSVGYMNYAINR